MALTFAKKGAAAAKPAPQNQDDSSPKNQSNSTASPAKSPTAGKLPFMMKGVKAKTAMANEEAKAELQKQEKGKMWRYWMAPDTERRATFLDGEVDEDGMLDVPMYYEHALKLNGNWENFICTAEQEGHCVLCERGDTQSYLVGVMTVCDHTPHKIKSGANAGKEIRNQRKLFVAKKESIKQLAKAAVKRGGLTGCTFDISRGNDKTANVGNQFDFVEKKSLPEIAVAYELDPKEFVPADYGAELIYRTNEQLIELGLGKAPSGPGYEKGVGAGKGKNLKDEL